MWGELGPKSRSLSGYIRDVLQYNQLWEKLIDPNLAVIEQHDSDIHYMILNGRSFFFSWDGRLGLCLGNTRRGDSVVILDGCSTPFVIRENPEAFGTLKEWLKQGKTWVFVGECYPQGAMNVAGFSDWGWHDLLSKDYGLESNHRPAVMDDGSIVIGSYPGKVFKLG
ncbi:hypothetical protein EK21DRAFT_91953 [Setomelanomma holmii]|uniref:Uncharacterized protein n=1 Tax=Setomelanomma holmii TaxID=210430 RepID=A0A9P4H3U6_9PLEO|nr:hypothetical protein EK21DRAFT_91953 [Setomelanomma holmii]